VRCEADVTESPSITPRTREFESLLSGVLERAYGVAYHLTRSRQDAEDLVQEAALSAFKNFHQFQSGTNFRAWYMRILTNAFFAHYRRRRRSLETTSLEDAQPLHLLFASQRAGLLEHHKDPAALIVDRLGEERVGKALGDLPDEFRVVCTLYFMNDASYQEISEMLDCPVGTVRSRLHRGRRMLQKALWQVAEESGVVTALAARGEA
jgi:RNA polymerase sigma-70 factor (ECF subfamily)